MPSLCLAKESDSGAQTAALLNQKDKPKPILVKYRKVSLSYLQDYPDDWDGADTSYPHDWLKEILEPELSVYVHSIDRIGRDQAFYQFRADQSPDPTIRTSVKKILTVFRKHSYKNLCMPKILMCGLNF